MITIKNFESKLMKIDKKSFKNTDVYCIGYVTTKSVDDYESIHSVNSLYLIIDKVDGYIRENNVNKYLVFVSTDKNK